MGLNLGLVFAYDDRFRFGKAARHVAARDAGRTAHVADERQAGRRGKARSMTDRRACFVMHQWRAGRAGGAHAGNEGKRAVIDFDET